MATDTHEDTRVSARTQEWVNQLDPFHPDRAAAIRAMCAPVDVVFIGRIP
jgi:hypothetical protein